ncbi:MAG: UDP-glucose 4-epimerase, partial [Gammaproteobacteria bacterium]
ALPISLPALRAVVRRRFRDAGRSGRVPQIDLSAANFSRLMRTLARFLPERDRKAIDTLPVYLDYLAGVQEFGNDATLAALAAHDIRLPDIGQVVECCLGFYLETMAAKGR